MPDTDELKDDDQLSRSPSHHNDQGLEDHHPEAHFPPGFPPFYGYPPDGSGGEGGPAPNGMPQFFPFPPGTPHPALYQPFAANMPGGPLFPIPIGQLTGVSQFKTKRMQVKNAVSVPNTPAVDVASSIPCSVSIALKRARNAIMRDLAIDVRSMGSPIHAWTVLERSARKALNVVLTNDD
jgi:hypothetical protein